MCEPCWLRTIEADGIENDDDDDNDDNDELPPAGHRAPLLRFTRTSPITTRLPPMSGAFLYAP